MLLLNMELKTKKLLKHEMHLCSMPYNNPEAKDCFPYHQGEKSFNDLGDCAGKRVLFR